MHARVYGAIKSSPNDEQGGGEMETKGKAYAQLHKNLFPHTVQTRNQDQDHPLASVRNSIAETQVASQGIEEGE